MIFIRFSIQRRMAALSVIKKENNLYLMPAILSKACLTKMSGMM